jgi:ribonuclease P protein component
VSVFRSEAVAPDRRFPRTYRLTSRRQFVEVYGKGWKAHRRSVTVFGLPNDEGHSRIGLTVTRKIGGAVVRNRVKRVLREAFRRNREAFAQPLDLVVNARPPVVELAACGVERDFLAAVAELARRTRG